MEKENIDRILVVDDEELILRVLKRFARRSHYSIVTASNGFEALRAITNNEDPFDLMITDFDMPGMDGLQLIQGSKTFGKKAPRHTLVMTADENNGDKVRSAFPKIPILDKPITWQDIEKHILELERSSG